MPRTQSATLELRCSGETNIGLDTANVRIELDVTSTECRCRCVHPFRNSLFGYLLAPITPGHEFVGRIVKFGDTDGPTSPLFPGLKVGDLATAEQIVPCRCCRYCDRGNYHLCLPHDIYGFRQLTPGAMATYMRWPRNSIIHKIPDHVPPHHAAFVEPLACSIWAVERAEIKFEDVVVVSGCGPLGLGMIAAAKLKNPKLLIALDVVEWKLDIAKACGATVVLNPAVDDVREKVLALTDGYGCDVYIEAAASDVSVTQGLHMLCKGGRFVGEHSFGVLEGPGFGRLELRWC